MYGYRGVTALVTGASKGLGVAYAHELARRGAHLVLVARSGDALRQVADEIRTAHQVEVNPVRADLAGPGGVAGLVAELDRRGRTVDLLVNDAGAGAVGPSLSTSLQRNVGTAGGVPGGGAFHERPPMEHARPVLLLPAGPPGVTERSGWPLSVVVAGASPPDGSRGPCPGTNFTRASGR